MASPASLLGCSSGSKHLHYLLEKWCLVCLALSVSKMKKSVGMHSDSHGFKLPSAWGELRLTAEHELVCQPRAW